MKGFIEIRNEYGNRMLINTKYIEEVREETESDSCSIYMAFICPNSVEQDYYRVNKPYGEIVELIKGATE